MQSIYQPLRTQLLSHGYHIITEDQYHLEAENSLNQCRFDTILEEQHHLEATLYLVSEQLIVQYDILTAEYHHDLFTDDQQTQALATLWQQKLAIEVERLALQSFSSPDVGDD